MIYRPTERAGRGVRRSVSGEVALALVATALVAALILQGTCSGWDGAASRWLCVNNDRLAAVKDARATGTPTETGAGRQPAAGGANQAPPVLPGQATPAMPVPSGPQSATPVLPASPQAPEVLMAPLQTATALAEQRNQAPQATIAPPTARPTRPGLAATRTPRPTRTPRQSATSPASATGTATAASTPGTETATPDADSTPDKRTPTTEGYPGPVLTETAEAAASATAEAKESDGYRGP